MRRPPISLLFMAFIARREASSVRNFKTANPLDLPDMFFITLQWCGLKLEKACSSSSSVVCQGMFPTYMQEEPRRSTSLSLSIRTCTARSFITTEFRAATAATARSTDAKWIKLWKGYCVVDYQRLDTGIWDQINLNRTPILSIVWCPCGVLSPRI